jgi:hypothetical protein
MNRTPPLLALFTLALGAQEADYRGSYTVPLTNSVLQYERQPSRNPVSLLQQRLDKGQARLEWEPKYGYLLSVLRELSVPASSQVLVFSKTSLQARRISPATPRAIYFNDDVYVGWVQNGEVMEISAADSELGGVFFSLRQQKSDKPRFERGDQCLQCHASAMTTGVPGHLVRSVYTDPEGYPVTTTNSFVTDHRSPFSERWGGWYVSGTYGAMRHMGNVLSKDVKRPEAIDREAGANLTDLSKLFDVKPYLTPHSDVAALMVLEHQTKVHNVIVRAGFEARAALQLDAEMKKLLGESGAALGENTRKRIARAADILSRYLLFADEFPLTSPVRGASPFAAEFAARGPKDAKGRSLRDLDLNTRLFKYPLSYLIYSDAFAALPAELRAATWKRIGAALAAAGRQDIREILDATFTAPRSE